MLTTTFCFNRTDLAARYLRGSGLEIGALHFPLPLPEHAHALYVDRLSVTDLKIQYPELASHNLVPVDIIDDGETLHTIPNASQDFIIANHFLEHCEDPIGTLLSFFRVLKSGGILYMAIPDKRFTFDRDRPLTTLNHLINDHTFGPEHSREAHYREYVRLVDKAQSPEGEDMMYRKRTEEKFSIHFHVWTEKEIRELLDHMKRTVIFDIEYFQRHEGECLCILRFRQCIEDETALRVELEDMIRQYGPWTAHNVRLSENVYTMGLEDVGSAGGVRRFMQIVTDVLRKPWSDIRLLDLGCLEGLYALEAGYHGAEAIGIDARITHIIKANFAKEIIGIPTVRFAVDDVRAITEEKYGLFDAILCTGLLYHLDEPDVFKVIERMAAMCTGCLIIETHISAEHCMSISYKDKTYWGKKIHEHDPSSTLQERERNGWASIDNPESFWLTKISLFNALSHAGFTSVYECENPPLVRAPDRCTLVAIKGTLHTISLTSPLYSHQPGGDWSE
jgi:2-polyprenyl-3-methyl-5-hydroxy-6-metoxy-1,4-benzoquinol methylase